MRRETTAYSDDDTAIGIVVGQGPEGVVPRRGLKTVLAMVERRLQGRAGMRQQTMLFADTGGPEHSAVANRSHAS